MAPKYKAKKSTFNKKLLDLLKLDTSESYYINYLTNRIKMNSISNRWNGYELNKELVDFLELPWRNRYHTEYSIRKAIINNIIIHSKNSGESLINCHELISNDNGIYVQKLIL
tara:strand:- start:100 stop:438 length:339 start_codon:yes stop_codon:yes gene_type:complete